MSCFIKQKSSVILCRSKINVNFNMIPLFCFLCYRQKWYTARGTHDNSAPGFCTCIYFMEMSTEMERRCCGKKILIATQCFLLVNILSLFLVTHYHSFYHQFLNSMVRLICHWVFILLWLVNIFFFICRNPI